MSNKVIIAVTKESVSKEQLEKWAKYMRNYLPHYYKKDPENPGKFKRAKPE